MDKNTYSIRRGKVLVIVLCTAILMIAGCSALWDMGFNNGYKDGYGKGADFGLVKGQEMTLADVQGILKRGGIAFDYTENNDGSYIIQILHVTSQGFMKETALLNKDTFELLNSTGWIPSDHQPPRFTANVYVTMELQDGLHGSESGNVITDIAETTIRNFLGFGNATSGTAEIGTNQTKYLACGNYSSAINSTMTQLDVECDNSSAFGRAVGTVVAWQNGTDAGFNVTLTQTANATVTINAVACHWFGTQQSNNNLFAVAAITQTAFAVNDNRTTTWVFTIDAN